MGLSKVKLAMSLLCAVFTLTACDGAGDSLNILSPLPKIVSDLPQGDASKGEELFKGEYACSACHGDPAIEGSNVVGSWTGTFKELGENRVEGYTTADYVYESILLPNKDISPECATGPCPGPPSSMPDTYRNLMSAQDIADVMAYLGIDTNDSNAVEVSYSPVSE